MRASIDGGLGHDASARFIHNGNTTGAGINGSGTGGSFGISASCASCANFANLARKRAAFLR